MLSRPFLLTAPPLLQPCIAPLRAILHEAWLRRPLPHQAHHGKPFTCTPSALSRSFQRLKPTRPTKRSPSEALVQALTDTGHHWAVPPESPAHKIDHSYVHSFHFDPASSATDYPHGRRRLLGAPSSAIGLPDESQPGVEEDVEPTRPREADAAVEDFQTVLAQFIRRFHPSPGRAVAEAPVSLRDTGQTLNDDALRFLQRYGYDAADVATWAWILTARSSERAAERLNAACNSVWNSSREMPPPFVLSFLLRRQNVTPRALDLLIWHAWDRLENRYDPAWDYQMAGARERTLEETVQEMTLEEISQETTSVLPYNHEESDEGINGQQVAGENHESESSCEYPVSLSEGQRDKPKKSEERRYKQLSLPAITILIIRLIRHARKVQPAQLPDIATMYCRHVFDRAFGAGSSPRARAITGAECSRMLKLFADPCYVDRYLSTVHQQRAQSILVEQMHAVAPPVLLSREGFQAIARVQLAQRKTGPERRWAGLKAPGWPPWKEEKMGADAAVGADAGRTRAARVLASAGASGYAADTWDQTAKILAGWDTDATPTIQTRRLHAPLPARDERGAALDGVLRRMERVWAARVVATRTLDEAWATFLAFRAQGLPHSVSVYNEMLGKLIAERRRAERARARDDPPSADDDDARAALPGDGLETAPPPANPRDGVYTRTAPPTLAQFLQLMAKNGTRPRHAHLAALIADAPTLDDALALLTRALPDPPTALPLLLGDADPPAPGGGLGPAQVPPAVFAAWIGALPALAPAAAATHPRLAARALPIAFALLRAYAPANGPAFVAFAQATTRRPPPRAHGRHPPTLRERAAAWAWLRRGVLALRRRDLRPTGPVLQAAAQLAGHLARHAWRVLEARRDTRGERQHHDAVRHALHAMPPALRWLKALFAEVVGERLPPHPPPRWLEPDAARDAPAPAAPAPDPAADADAADAADAAPPLRWVPAYATLHVLARALRAARDAEGLRALAAWMSARAPALDRRAAQTANGPRLRRRTLVCVRAALEWPRFEREEGEEWAEGLRFGADGEDDGEDDGEERMGEASAEVREEVRRIVEGVPGWGGWPGDEEVQRYLDPVRRD